MNGFSLYILISIAIALSGWNLKTTHDLVTGQAITNTHLSYYTQGLEEVKARLAILETTKNP